MNNEYVPVSGTVVCDDWNAHTDLLSYNQPTLKIELLLVSIKTFLQIYWTLLTYSIV